MRGRGGKRPGTNASGVHKPLSPRNIAFYYGNYTLGEKNEGDKEMERDRADDVGEGRGDEKRREGKGVEKGGRWV